MAAMRQVSARDRHTLCVTFLLASVSMVRRSGSDDWMDSLSDAAEMAELEYKEGLIFRTV